MRGLNEVVQYLVDHGARLNARDFRGRTPYRLAEGSKQSFQFQAFPETAELLKQLGRRHRGWAFPAPSRSACATSRRPTPASRKRRRRDIRACSGPPPFPTERKGRVVSQFLVSPWRRHRQPPIAERVSASASAFRAGTMLVSRWLICRGSDSAFPRPSHHLVDLSFPMVARRACHVPPEPIQGTIDERYPHGRGAVGLDGLRIDTDTNEHGAGVGNVVHSDQQMSAYKTAGRVKSMPLWTVPRPTRTGRASSTRVVPGK